MAQSSQPDDPASVARAAFAAYEARACRRVAELTHPDALARFREQHLQMARAREAHPPLTAVHDSALREAVAQYFDDMRAHTLAEYGNPALAAFAGVRSLAEVERLSPEAVLAAYLEGQDPKPDNYDDGRPPVSTRRVAHHAQPRPLPDGLDTGG